MFISVVTCFIRRSVATSFHNWTFLFSKTFKTTCFSLVYCHFMSKATPATMNQFGWDDLPKPNVIFVLGGPGAGKGTQCQRISKEFGYMHLSAGDLLRKEQNTAGSAYGELIAEHIKNGTIVPVSITCSLLMNAMLEHMNALARIISGDHPIPQGNFLIDGFPRNQDNLDGWKKYVDHKVNVQFVLFFECPEEVCIERCLKRGKNSGRTDDNLESLKKRLRTYLNETIPIVEYYDKLNLVRKVDSSRPVEEVHEDCRKLLLAANNKPEN